MGPREELEATLAGQADRFEEPQSLDLLAALREQGMLRDDEWVEILSLVADWTPPASRRQARRDEIVIDSDARNADWIKIVRARRLAGRMLPSWATLWVWYQYRDVDGVTNSWPAVGRIAASLGIEPLEDSFQ